MIQAIFFAANGVLADTHDLHFQALNEALESFGFEISPEEDASIYRGLSTKRKLEMLTKNKGLDPSFYAQIRAKKQLRTIELIDRQVELDLQKIDLFSAAKEAGLKLAVCSNSQQSTLVATLEAMGLNTYVDLCVGNDLGLPAKPAPDMYLHAASMLGIPIARCAIVERSSIGIQSAKGTGCPTIVRVKAPDEVVLSLLNFLLPNQAGVRYPSYS